MNCWRFMKSAKVKADVRRDLVVGELGEIVVAEAFVGSFGDGFDFGVSAEDHDHAGELASVFVEVFLVGDGRRECICPGRRHWCRASMLSA